MKPTIQFIKEFYLIIGYKNFNSLYVNFLSGGDLNALKQLWINKKTYKDLALKYNVETLLIEDTFEKIFSKIIANFKGIIDDVKEAQVTGYKLEYRNKINTEYPEFKRDRLLIKMTEKELYDLLSIKIENLKVSNRFLYVIQKNGFFTFGEIAYFTDEDFKKIRNCGTMLTNEFKDLLQSHSIQS